MIKDKIAIALIHNNNIERLSEIKPNIQSFILELAKNNNVNFFEINWQPELSPASLSVGISRDWTYWRLNRKWNKYKNVKPRNLILDFSWLIFKLTTKYIFNVSQRGRWLKSCSIEMFVTQKHVEAIFRALNEQCDYLLVFEDDAVFEKESIEKLCFLFDFIENKKNLPVYVDIAGGCPFDVLRYEKIVTKKDDLFRYFNKPGTNTACCYLMNNNQLKLFGNFLIKNPKLIYIGIDWLFNKMFIMQEHVTPKSFCVHAAPPFLRHGSVVGDFKAWQR